MIINKDICPTLAPQKEKKLSYWAAEMYNGNNRSQLIH